MALMLAVTVTPVLAGFVPGVTVTVSSTTLPAVTGFGLAAPTPLGLVGAPQMIAGEAVLRGFGALAAKSVALLSVSVQPFKPRTTALVALGAGVGPAPSKQVAALPYPTTSTTVAPEGHAVPLVINVLVLVNTTLPAVAAIETVPVTSGAGNAAPFAP